MTFLLQALIIIVVLACATPILFGFWAIICAPIFWLIGKALDHKWITLAVLLIVYFLCR